MLLPSMLFLAVNKDVKIMALSGEIEGIEAVVVREAKLRKEFKGLLSLPGIGQILALSDVRGGRHSEQSRRWELFLILQVRGRPQLEREEEG